ALELTAYRGDPDPAARRHYLRTGGRPPSNAVPIRRCVAPFLTAASRSLLIPAEITVAPGWAARTAAAVSRRAANARSGSASIGATAITPAGRSRPVAAAASASATASPA